MSRLLLVSVLLSAICSSGLAAEVTRWIRFDDAGTVRYGLVEGDVVRVIDGQPWSHYKKENRTLSLSDIRPLVPTEPKVVLAAALNYRSHLGERTAPTQPQFFWKTPHCLVAHGEPIRLPQDSHNVHYEAELVIVIGRTVENATLEEADTAIFGFTCGNDVSERDWAANDLQWWRAKAARSFGPVGPVIVTGLDWKTLRIRGLHNGKVVQDGSVSDLLFSPAKLVQFASRYVTLRPGDLIFTATPGKTQSLRPGDTYEVVIDGVGSLLNPVKMALPRD